MKPLYIFDLDGTLALIEHRRPILDEPGKNDEKWRRFYAGCDKDQPNLAVIAIMDALIRSSAEIWIFSGRSDEVREKTARWLDEHTFLYYDELTPQTLIMRQLGDTTPDDVLKKQWLDGMLVDDRQRLVGVFDDRQRVVDMWRAAGVTCFQVAPGDF